MLAAALAPQAAVMSDNTPHMSPPAWLTPSGMKTNWTTGAATATQPAVTDTFNATAAPSNLLLSSPTGVEDVDLHPSCIAAGLPAGQIQYPYVVYLEKVS